MNPDRVHPTAPPPAYAPMSPQARTSVRIAALLVVLAPVMALMIGAAGCSSSESEASLLAAAQRQSEQRDHKAALIHLRNAIQRYPDSAAVRLAMGRTLLESGDAAAAAVELDKALALRTPEEQVLPPLARALLASGEAPKVISRFAGSSLAQPVAQADLLSSLSAAHSLAGQDRPAAALLDRALAADPQSPWALVLLARRQATEQNIDGALRTLQRAQVTHPDKAQILHLEGELHLVGRADEAAAQRAFEAALTSRADHVPSHASLVALALQRANLPLARQRVEAMAKVAPRAPMTQLLQGRLALAEDQLDKAEQLAQQLLRTAPEDVRVLMLAGETALRKGSMAQAENHLARAVQRAPEALPARKMLAQALLKGDEPRRALTALQPAVERGQADGATHALLAQAYLKDGQTAKAQQHFRKASELSPQDTRIRTAAALAQMGKGQSQAVAELERIASSDTGTTADLALISAKLQGRDYAAALQAAQRLERKQPDKALAANLQGRILLAQGRPDDARLAFDRALKIDPRHTTSAIELARLEAASGRLNEAQVRLETLARQSGREVQALMSLAELKARHGGSPQEVEELLGRAIKAAPDAAEARLALIQQRAARGDRDGALKAAQEAVVALPKHPGVLESLARMESATGSGQQAVSTLRKLVALDPQNPGAMVSLAEMQIQVGERAGARQTLKRVLEMQPDLLAAQRSLMAVELLEGRRDEAQAIARQIQRQRADEPIGHLLEGDIAMHQQAWPAATKAYRAAQKISPTPEGSIKLYGALTAAGQKSEAAAHATDWEKRNPRDIAFIMHLGERAAAQGQWAQAEKHYARADKAQPDNPLVLNNLAYAMARQAKPGASTVAERANRLLPDRPALMDTLALALAEEKRLDRALDVQRRAVERAGAAGAEFRLNLARLYLRAGDKASARQELQTLAGLGPTFPGQKQVRELLESI